MRSFHGLSKEFPFLSIPAVTRIQQQLLTVVRHLDTLKVGWAV